MPDNQIACATCRRPLDRFTVGGQDRWIHPTLGGPYDHDPIPIFTHRIDMVTTCDFCGVPYPNWVYPTSSFTIDVESNIGWGSSDDWSACSECHYLIERNEWDRLVERSMRKFPDLKGVHRQYVKQALIHLHQKFAENRSGEAYRP